MKYTAVRELKGIDIEGKFEVEELVKFNSTISRSCVTGGPMVCLFIDVKCWNLTCGLLSLKTAEHEVNLT